jgi:hypothetical protein
MLIYYQHNRLVKPENALTKAYHMSSPLFASFSLLLFFFRLARRPFVWSRFSLLVQFALLRSLYSMSDKDVP